MTNETSLKKDLIAIIVNLNRLITDGKFDQVDDVLSNLNPEQESPAVMVTYLRVTYAARGKLPSWEGAVERAYRAFMERGLEADKLLQGMLKGDFTEGKPIC